VTYITPKSATQHITLYSSAINQSINKTTYTKMTSGEQLK